ncbi:hypothetical protein C8R44DRAFT_975973 [Mycena epipterygia]|nr:hypothetical protein C8R44DRAFT_975973 [Mycena epipterygia]
MSSSETLPTPTQTEQLLLKSSCTPGPLDVLSPVRRLPPEILCEILMPSSLPSPHDSDLPADEVKNIAKSDLLRVSHVCAQWRALALGTPRLWSDIALDLYCWPKDPAPFLQLLRTSLERGAPHPLKLAVTIGSFHEPFRPVLELLAEHCDRWQSVSLEMEGGMLGDIQHVKGRLGALERLSLKLSKDLRAEDKSKISDMSVFESAPRLTHVHFASENTRLFPQLPWKQLRSFTLKDPTKTEEGTDIPRGLVFMQNLSHPEAAFEFLDFGVLPGALLLGLLPLTSGISSLLLEVWSHFPAATAQALGEFMDCLTLPHLHELRFVHSSFSDTILLLVSQFESFSLRSSFADTLRFLEITHVAITAEDLVRALSTLESLQRLVISDHQRPSWTLASDYILISDALLLRLTSTPDSSDSTLVPKLNHIACTSLFQFTAGIYVDFVTSRIAPDRPPFQAFLHPLGVPPDDFDTEVLRELVDLTETGELRFVLK